MRTCLAHGGGWDAGTEAQPGAGSVGERVMAAYGAGGRMTIDGQADWRLATCDLC
ncbi:hypothetical protein C8Q77DRAFT_1095571 [Trametes polyzona]|nr:hypothetical protein C8Q77DRAFT_1095571 [Trametes polyzona]